MMKHLLLVIAVLALNACATSAGVKQAEVKRLTPEELVKLMPKPVAAYTLETLIADTKRGLLPDDLIAKIKASESLYDLKTSDVLRLSKAGVDVQVLDYIQKSKALAQQNYLAEEINKRAREKAAALKHARMQQLNRYYDPFWGPYGYYGNHIPIGPAGRLWRGRRLGWGLSYGRRLGYPFGW